MLVLLVLINDFFWLAAVRDFVDLSVQALRTTKKEMKRTILQNFWLAVVAGVYQDMCSDTDHKHVIAFFHEQ